MVQMSKKISISSCFEPLYVPLGGPAAQYIPPTSSFFYVLYEISVPIPKAWSDYIANLLQPEILNKKSTTTSNFLPMSKQTQNPLTSDAVLLT